jgi:hypothetical protein
MPDYLVTDPATGQRIKMTGPAPPSEALIRLALAKVQPLPSHAPTQLQTADPLQAMQKAQTIGPARVGERYQEDLNPSLVGIARKVLGGAQRPPSVAAEDPYGIGAWLKGAGPMPTPIAAEIQAYHGSPHDFEKFLLEKIGTGEGAQAYGHGLYFAENPAVAAEYKKALSSPSIEVGGKPFKPAGRVDDIVAAWLEEGHLKQASGLSSVNPPTYAREGIRDMLQRTEDSGAPGVHEDYKRALLKVSELEQQGLSLKPGGKTYHVSIKADPDQFLDWDKPLSQQSAKVKEALKKFGIEDSPEQRHAFDDALMAALEGNGPATLPKEPPNPLGANIYESSKVVPGSYRDRAAASAALKEAGIPGIKYLDQGSRGMPEWRVTWKDRVPTRFDTEEQAKAFLAENQAKGRPVVGVEHAPNTSNYVVFDDKLIDILKKYAVAGAVGGSLASLGQPQTEEQK